MDSIRNIISNSADTINSKSSLEQRKLIESD